MRRPEAGKQALRPRVVLDDVHLRTAVSVDPQGCAHFDDEYRAHLRRVILTQGDAEPARVEQQRQRGMKWLSRTTSGTSTQVTVEEGRHLWAMVYLLHAYFVGDGREEAEWGASLQVDGRTVVDDDGIVTAAAGAPLAPERTYRLAMVRNLLDGLDQIEPRLRFARAFPHDVPPPDSGRDIKLAVVDSFSVALWRRLGGFDAVDTNKDDVVTASETAAAVARATAETPSIVTAELVIRALDPDKNHVLTRAETDAAADDRAAGRRSLSPRG